MTKLSHKLVATVNYTLPYGNYVSTLGVLIAHVQLHTVSYINLSSIYGKWQFGFTLGVVTDDV